MPAIRAAFGDSVASADGALDRAAIRTLVFADGTKKTLGVMLPGEYVFNTDKAEVMEILAGVLDVLLPGKTDWQKVKGGESYNVPAKSQFSLKVQELADYCCSFVEG